MALFIDGSKGPPKPLYGLYAPAAPPPLLGKITLSAGAPKLGTSSVSLSILAVDNVAGSSNTASALDDASFFPLSARRTPSKSRNPMAIVWQDHASLTSLCRPRRRAASPCTSRVYVRVLPPTRTFARTSTLDARRTLTLTLTLTRARTPLGVWFVPPTSSSRRRPVVQSSCTSRRVVDDAATLFAFNRSISSID